MNVSSRSDYEGALFPWQSEIWQQLMKYDHQGRIPHAMIISGCEGYGKLNLALLFGNYLLCSGDKTSDLPCRSCTSCRLFVSNTHPDLVLVEPAEAGKAIPIDRIRELGETLALNPQYNQYRVVIVNSADQMNSAAANAFLKTLEEPSEKNVLILLTARPWDLPATVTSRCQCLKVELADSALACAWLGSKIAQSETDALLTLAGGGPLRALEMSESGILEQRNLLFSLWGDLAENRLSPIGAAERLSSMSLSDVFLWITGWTIDMIRLSMAPYAAKLSNPDFRIGLQAEVEKLDLKQLFRFYDDLIQSGSLLGTPINSQLMLENVLIDWASLERH